MKSYPVKYRDYFISYEISGSLKLNQSGFHRDNVMSGLNVAVAHKVEEQISK